MNEEKIYPTMVIRSQAEAIELLEKENKKLQNNWNELKKWLEENWQQSQDIWFVKIINKMQETERGNNE